MATPRFFSSFENDDQKILLDDPDEFQHLSRVLRLRKGDEVELVNGKGALATGVVDQLGVTSAVIACRDIQVVPPVDMLRLTIACAIPKRAKFESIIEKCTELGVTRIIPLLSERTEVVADLRRNEKKADRFARVVINAAKQAKILHFPAVSEPLSFSMALHLLIRQHVKILIPWLEGERIPVARALAGIGACREVAFFIGPEGDFTSKEIRMAVDAGAVPVSLGDTVLKVDTAAIAVSAFARLSSLL